MKAPFVSVILPVRNEARYIRESLGAVIAQDYPKDRYEILVADGISNDGTREIVAEIAAGSGTVPVILIDNPQRIVPTALNRALERSQGEILIRVDGHCEIAPDYISRCVSHLQNTAAAGVGGPIQTIGETHLAKAIAIGMSSLFGVGGSAFRTVDNRDIWVDTVAFPAYPRETILHNGLFDEELVRNQDDEYNYRIRKQGGKILLAHDLRSRYYSRTSLRLLWRQYFQYGFWKVRVLQKHPLQMKLRQFAPPAFVGLLILSLLIDVFLPAVPPIPISLAVVLPYLAANFIASLLVSARSGWAYLPALPIVFLTLHFAYGLGFLAGLVRFAGRWGDREGRVPAGDFLSAPTRKL